jgi:hypothetical protein
MHLFSAPQVLNPASLTWTQRHRSLVETLATCNQQAAHERIQPFIDITGAVLNA